MKKYCFGIDIGGTTVKCGLFDVQGNVLDKWEIKTRSEGNGENIIPDVAAAIETKISEKEIEKADIAGIGVGVPGPVNEEGAVVTAVNLHWGYVDLAGEMEKLTGITTKVGNDANVAALGEMWKGGREECSDGYAGNRRRRRYYHWRKNPYRKSWSRRRNRSYPR